MASLNQLKLEKLPTVIGHEIWHFPTLERGMLKARELIEGFPKTAHGRVIIADEILSAKGRFNRQWLANKGGLWCVFTLYDEILPENRSLLSVVIALAIVKTIRSFGLDNVFIKWINDIHFQGRKIAGVLMEKYKDWIILGIGINVNNQLPKTLPAINLKGLLKREIEILKVLENLIFWFNYYYQILWKYDSQSIEFEKPFKNYLIEKYKKYSDTLGKCVYYSYNVDIEGDGFIGIAIDFTEKGELVLQVDNEEIIVNSGEILYL